MSLPTYKFKPSVFTPELSAEIGAQMTRFRSKFLDRGESNLEDLIAQASLPMAEASSQKEKDQIRAAGMILASIGHKNTYLANEETFRQKLDKTAFQQLNRSAALVQNNPSFVALYERAQEALAALNKTFDGAAPGPSAAEGARNAPLVQSEFFTERGEQARRVVARTEDAGKIDEWTRKEELGRGGSAVAWLATRTVDGKQEDAVLKIITDRRLIRRLRREVKNQRRMDKDSLLIEARLKGERPYIVLKHVPGPTLRKFLDKRELMHVKESLPIIEAVLTALVPFHEKGVIHKDVKPDNIIYEAGIATLIDLGLARLVEKPEDREIQSLVTLTKTGEISGTPTYAPEEQRIKGLQHLIRLATDIYPLAVMHWEMTSTDPGETLADQRLFFHVSRVMAKARAKLPADRYQTAGKMLQALAKAKEMAQEDVRKAEQAAVKTAPEAETKATAQKKQGVETQISAVQNTPAVKSEVKEMPLIVTATALITGGGLALGQALGASPGPLLMGVLAAVAALCLVALWMAFLRRSGEPPAVRLAAKEPAELEPAAIPTFDARALSSEGYRLIRQMDMKGLEKWFGQIVGFYAKLVERAERAFNEGRFEEAMELARSVLEGDSQYPPLNSNGTAGAPIDYGILPGEVRDLFHFSGVHRKIEEMLIKARLLIKQISAQPSADKAAQPDRRPPA